MFRHAVVLPNLSNPSKHLGSIRKTWSTALRNAQLTPFPIYSLRATFASRLSAAGVPDGFVSQMLDVGPCRWFARDQLDTNKNRYDGVRLWRRYLWSIRHNLSGSSLSCLSNCKILRRRRGDPVRKSMTLL